MKKILTIILIVSLLFSFGCAKKEVTRGHGITVEFEEGRPPDIIYKGDEVDIELRVVNQGLVDLYSEDIKAKLKGVAATEIFDPDKVEASNREELPSAELGPTVTTITLGPINYEGELYKDTKATITAEICFPYITKIQANEFFVSDQQTVVDRGKILSSDNSAAPVQVSNLNEYAAKDKVRFDFIVKNVGRGKVVNECFPEEKEAEEVKVIIVQPDVDCETLGGGDSGKITLNVNGIQKVECEMDVSEGEVTKTPLIIDLEYHYDFDISKSVTIRK